MAGFLGMGNFTKPGSGVKRNEQQQKKRFFNFFDVYFRKFWSLVKLNLLFLIFCIPIVTIGPSISAMMKIVKCYNEEKPTFLFSDFFAAFKENFLQSFLISIINAVLFAGCYYGFIHYMVRFRSGMPLFIIPTIIIVIFAVILLFASFYAYLLIITVDLKLFAIIKNSILFAFIGAKTNFLTLFFTLLVILPCFILYPFSIILLILITFSTIAMIVCYNSFQYIYKFLVKPYYDNNGLKNPYEIDYSDESIFKDATE